MRSFLAALAALLTCAVLAPAANAAPVFGFNDSAVIWNQLSAPADAKLAAAAGAGTTRITVDWRWAEATPGVWNLATYDAMYNAAVANGQKPTIVLLFAPRWSWAEGAACVSDCRFPPSAQRMDAWRNAVRTMVRRYPKLAALEVWNEPNLKQYWQSGPDPVLYSTMLKEAYETVRAEGSTAKVLGGALSSANDQDEAAGRPVMSYRKFLKGMYDNGAKANMDAISLHPYPDDIDLWRHYKMLTEVREIRDRAGDESRPLWLTELGITTVGKGSNHTFTENDQANTHSRMYKELRTTRNADVHAVLVHTLMDPSFFAATDPEHGYGVVRADGRKKPAYCTFAKIHISTFSCPKDVAKTVANPTQDLRWTSQELVQGAIDAARAYRRATGSYTGLTNAALKARDSRLSDQAANPMQVPGLAADPTRIGIWTWDAGDAQKVLLCSASRADRTYCAISEAGTGAWTYGHSTGDMYATAGAVSGGTVWWW